MTSPGSSGSGASDCLVTVRSEISTSALSEAMNTWFAARPVRASGLGFIDAEANAQLSGGHGLKRDRDRLAGAHVKACAPSTTDAIPAQALTHYGRAGVIAASGHAVR